VSRGLGGRDLRGDTPTELRRFADLDAVVRWQERDADAAASPGACGCASLGEDG
jgi:hypothetical protein